MLNEHTAIGIATATSNFATSFHQSFQQGYQQWDPGAGPPTDSLYFQSSVAGVPEPQQPYMGYEQTMNESTAFQDFWTSQRPCIPLYQNVFMTNFDEVGSIRFSQEDMNMPDYSNPQPPSVN